MKARHRAQGGFTLLEVLLAMGIVALLAVSLFASFHAVYKARNSATSAVAPVRTAQVAMDMICHDLAGALPPTGTIAGAFVGQHMQDGGILYDAVQFYAIDSGFGQLEVPGTGGVQREELALIAGDQANSNVLVRRITGNLLADLDQEVDEQVICRGVRTLTLRYFDGFQWQDAWDSTAVDNVLPAAVEVTLELATPGVDPNPGYKMVRIIPLSCHRELTTQIQGL